MTAPQNTEPPGFDATQRREMAEALALLSHATEHSTFTWGRIHATLGNLQGKAWAAVCVEAGQRVMP